MHLKRQKIPKKWPVPRKGTAYIVRPSFNLKNGIPILVILRDILKLAQNRKEVKKAIHEKNILLNSKPITDEKNSALLFDIIKVVPSKKNYRIELSENGKFEINEIKESEANKKTSKIVNKKILKGKKEQLNLIDGRNFISKIKCNINDSVLIDLTKKDIGKCIPLKEKSNAIVFEGKHSGKKGKVNKINPERKMVELDIKDKKINVLIKQLMVVE
jgi:small subunit ribosomal protein S4e|tara:strand:+ start:689 stop:1336 length:648 start_codon:yes stop_codon:yes gene_type:complete